MFYERIAEVAKEEPKRPAMIVSSQPGTYDAILYEKLHTKLANAVDLFLKKTLMKPKDIVWIEAQHQAMVPQLVIMVQTVGAVAFPVPPSVGDQTKSRIFDPVSPQFIMARQLQRVKFEQKHNVEAGDMIHFTSGSNGPQKLVIRPSKNIYDEAVAVATHLGLDGTKKILIMSPLEHSFGCGVWRASMYAGSTLLIAPSDKLATKLIQIRSLIKTHKPDYIFGVPYLFQVLARQNVELPPTTRCFAGGEVLPPSVVKLWQDTTGSTLQQEYGLGEGGITTMALPNSSSRCLGQPIPGVRLEIANPGADGVGELIVYRNHAPKAYLLEGPADTFMPDGGIRTGDLVQELDGDYYFHGRIKSIVVIAGLKVTTFEIEEAIRSLDNIEDVAVVAGEDKITGERPVAFVVLKQTDAKVISRDWLREGLLPKLEEYKIPKRIVVMPKLPRTLSTKLDRESLRAML